MDEATLKQLWQNSNEKLEQLLFITQQNTEAVTRLQAQNAINALEGTKATLVQIGVAWVLGVGGLLYYLAANAADKVSNFFFVSAGLQVLLTAIAIAIYVYQLILIKEVDTSEAILVTQEKLLSLRASTLWVTKVLFLQLPLWTTFQLSEKLFIAENTAWIIFNALITLLFTAVAVWLFVNIKYENRHKKWFQFIFNGKEWQPLLQAMELLEQVKEYKR